MTTILKNDDRQIARLLKYGPFEQRSTGGWRFGTKYITDHVVDRLIAAGLAERDGDRVVKGVQVG